MNWLEDFDYSLLDNEALTFDFPPEFALFTQVENCGNRADAVLADGVAAVNCARQEKDFFLDVGSEIE